ncbi:hypothetical protein FNZ56_01395 [Pseudoluteimonas lycopersici]|uniref:TonB C-terminal domain-containing protein n=1 Tax=Pseudoluteimonas lycopersici TaxID=1324796 RepID=A0A516V285_9GAMM|nr:hypothetical protein [Lysobacter lycopersici]QDQ72625.1 hypothetical protein FNZ56_01395 [Lysobacter lycopersici]
MRIASLVLLVIGSLLQSTANAQESQLPSLAQCVTDQAQVTEENCYKPPMLIVLREFTQSHLRSIDTSVHLAYDERGHITSATLNQSTNRKRLDNAIIEWAKLIKLMPGQAGEGDLPIEIGIH